MEHALAPLTSPAAANMPAGAAPAACPLCDGALMLDGNALRCAACGFAAEPGAVVWRLDGPAWRLWPQALVSAAALLPLLLLRQVFGSPLAWGSFMMLATALPALTGVLFCVIFARSRRYLAAGPGGLSWKFPLGPVRRTGWSRLSFPDPAGPPRILSRGRPRGIALPVQMLSRAQQRALYAALRTCAERFTPAAAR